MERNSNLSFEGIFKPLLPQSVVSDVPRDSILGAVVASASCTYLTTNSIPTSISAGLLAAYLSIHSGVAGDITRLFGSFTYSMSTAAVKLTMDLVADVSAAVETKKATILEERRIAEEARIVEERRIEEEMKEAERIAELARVYAEEAEKAETERVEQLEKERLAEEARIEAERAEAEKLAEEARLQAEKIEAEKLSDDINIEIKNTEKGEALGNEAKSINEGERIEEGIAEQFKVEADRIEAEQLYEEGEFAEQIAEVEQRIIEKEAARMMLEQEIAETGAVLLEETEASLEKRLTEQAQLLEEKIIAEKILETEAEKEYLAKMRIIEESNLIVETVPEFRAREGDTIIPQIDDMQELLSEEAKIMEEKRLIIERAAQAEERLASVKAEAEQLAEEFRLFEETRQGRVIPSSGNSSKGKRVASKPYKNIHLTELFGDTVSDRALEIEYLEESIGLKKISKNN